MSYSSASTSYGTIWPGLCVYRLTILPKRYFVPTALHDNVGLSQNLSLVIGGCVQTMFFVNHTRYTRSSLQADDLSQFGSLIPTFFLDKLGRRNPMMWGSAGLAVSMMMIAVLLSFQRPGYSETLAKATSSASVAFFFTCTY